MKNVALYARVSTTQHHQDPEVQLRDLRSYCQQHNFTITAEYVDRGFRGGATSRPALDRLMVDARAHAFDGVLVWKFDRFARSAIHLAKALEEFRALNVAFVSLTEQVDTSTPAGKLVFTILGAVAEMEREIIAERIRAGLRNARANGKRLGRPRCLTDQRVVCATVKAAGGSIARAAKVLQASYGTIWALYHRAQRAQA